METNKEAKFHNVAESILKLVEKKGNEQVSITLLAKEADVSRAWIYKYFDGSRTKLLEYAIDYMGALYAHLDQDLPTSRPAEWIEAVLQRTERMCEEACKWPWLIPLYFRFKGTKTLFGKKILDVENKYLKKLSYSLEKCFKMETSRAISLAEALQAFRMGLAHHWTSSGFEGEKNKLRIYLAEFRPFLESIK